MIYGISNKNYLQGVSPLTVIYNIQNTQIWVVTQEFLFTFYNHRKINFHLEVSEDNLNYILCPKILKFSKRAVSTSGISNFFKIEKIAMNDFSYYKMPSPDRF